MELKQLVMRVLAQSVDRRTLVRAGRFLSSTGRLEFGNEIESNGERMVQQVVARHYPRSKPLVVLDVGANCGDWAVPMVLDCRRHGRVDVQIHAFEPVSATREMLERRVAETNLRSSVIVVGNAVSDRVGTVEMAVVGAGCGTNAIQPDPKQQIEYIESVKCTTIDAYCEQNGIDEMALLKVDAEGHDLYVVKGAMRMLAGKKVRVVQFEYNHRWIFSRSYLKDMFELAETYGYRIGKVTTEAIEFYDAWHLETETFREANFVMCHSECTEWFQVIPWWNK
jgi:FkbM family methyltransferase